MSSAFINDLTTQPVVLKTMSGKDIVAVKPDQSPLKGPCVFADGILVREAEHGAMFLPAPTLLARAGQDYAKYEVGTSYGSVAIKFPWKELQGRYKLKVSLSGSKITISALDPTSTDEYFIYALFEGGDILTAASLMSQVSF